MKLLFSPTQLLGTVGNNSVSVSKFFVWQPLWRVRQRKKTEIVFIGFACSMFTIKGSNTMSLSYIYRKKCSLADRMIPDLRHKPDDVCNQIHHPFTAGPLLANPLQEIGVIDLVIQVFWIVLIGGQKRLLHTKLFAEGWWYCRAPVSLLRRIKPEKKVDFEDGRLIGKDPAQLFAEAGWVDDRQAEIVPILKPVVATKSGTDLGPVLPVRSSELETTGTCSWRRGLRSGFRSGWWFWSCTRTCLVRPLRFFRSWCVIWSHSAAFTAVCLLLLLMSGADMRFVRCAVVECFSTGCATKRTFGSLFVVGFQVPIKDRYVWKLLFTAGALARFLPSMGSLVSY